MKQTSEDFIKLHKALQDFPCHSSCLKCIFTNDGNCILGKAITLINKRKTCPNCGQEIKD